MGTVPCPEEICFRKGRIDGQQLEQLARPLEKNGYGTYLLGILKGKVY
jgi:glucose-1-phosphate thymidylyltransferase